MYAAVAKPNTCGSWELSLAADAQQGLGRCDDGDALEDLTHEQIVIARDNSIDLGGQSQGEHRIVIGIAANRPRQGRRIDHLDKLAHLRQRPFA